MRCVVVKTYINRLYVMVQVKVYYMVNANNSKGVTSDDADNPCTGTSGFLMVLMGMLTLMVFIDPGMRFGLAKIAGAILFPIIGFDFNGDGIGDFPVMTIVAAAILTGTINTIIRHYSTDWVKQAEVQDYMKAYNNELKEANADNNQNKVKHLEKMQPEIMKMQSSMMNSQMKQMVFTMFLAIAIFTWLWSDFLEGLNYAYFSVPWDEKVGLLDRWFFLNNWIYLYSMFSIVFSQLLARGLKILSFKRTMEEEVQKESSEFNDRYQMLEKTYRQYKNDGMHAPGFERRMKAVRDMVNKGDTIGAILSLEELTEDLDKKHSEFTRAMELFRTSRKVMKKAKKIGINVEDLQQAWEDQQGAMNKGDYKSAAFFSQRVQALYDAYRDKHDDMAVDIDELKDEIQRISDAGVDVSLVKKHLKKARDHLSRSEYKETKAAIKKVRNELGVRKKEADSISGDLKTIEKKLDALRAEGVVGYNRLKERYVDLLEEKEKTGTLKRTDVKALLRDIEELNGLYRKAMDELNVARMMHASMKGSADQVKTDERLKGIERELEHGNYKKAIEDAKNLSDELRKIKGK